MEQKVWRIFVQEDFLRGRKRLTLTGYLTVAILGMIALAALIWGVRFVLSGLRPLG